MHQNEMLNSMAFRDLDLDLSILAQAIYRFRQHLLYIVFSFGNTFSYPCFTLLSPPTAEVTQVRSLINKIIISWHDGLAK